MCCCEVFCFVLKKRRERERERERERCDTLNIPWTDPSADPKYQANRRSRESRNEETFDVSFQGIDPDSSVLLRVSDPSPQVREARASAVLHSQHLSRR